MEHTTKRKIAKEVLIVISSIIVAYVLTTLYADHTLTGAYIIKIQGFKFYLQHVLFGGEFDNSYFFKAIAILYGTRLTIWAIVILAKGKQPDYQQKDV